MDVVNNVMMSGGCGGGLVEALNTRVYGNGSETLVLSHGYGSDQNVWHYLVPCLAFYFKVVVFDLVFSPNVNHPELYDPNKYSTFDAYAHDLICILDQLNLTNTIYLGHSMSAMIGCLAATKRPELFQHLILLSGSPRYLNDATKGYEGGFSKSELNTIFKEIQQNFSGWVQSFAPQAIIVNNSNAIREFERSLGRMKPEIALSVAKTVFLSDLRWVLPQVQVPSTIIQSKIDIIVPKFVAFYTHKKLKSKSSRVVILPTQGHFPQLTAYPLLLHVLKTVLHIN